MKNNNLRLISKFEKFMSDLEIEVIDIDRTIGAKAAALRSKYVGYKGMDALQIASSISAGCDLFFTNDKQLRQTKEIPSKTVDELWKELTSY